MRGGLATLELICFGPPTCRLDGAQPPTDVLWRKHLALLAYLALSPDRTRSRNHLLGLLWPEKDDPKARHSLNEAIRRLRAGLGAERLVSRGDAVTLAGEHLVVDDDGDALLRGEFLEGLALDDAPPFEEWAADRRAHYRAAAAKRLLDAGERALGRSAFGEAMRCASRVRSVEPLSEPATRLAMRAAALAGDATGALRTYHAFAQQFRTEFGEEPARELAALAGRIRNGRWRRRSVSSSDVEPPLAGRRDEHAAVFTTVADAAGRGARLVAIGGETGSGKTRLLAECASRWGLEGGVVALAHPLEGDRDVAWSALRGLGRGGLLDASGLAATDPAALRVLASLVPELGARVEPRSALDIGDIGRALTRLLRAIAEEQPVALLLDDAHWADAPTIEALAAAVAEAGDAPMLVALAVNDDACAGRTEAALGRLLGDVGRRIRGSIVRLEPLTLDDIGALVRAMAGWCGTEEQRDRLARRIAFETGGNPFLAVTLLHGLSRVTALRDDAIAWPPPRRTIDAPVPIAVPELVRQVTVARARQLDEASRTILLHACLAGRAIDPGTIAAVARLEPDLVLRGLTELERHHFVVFDGDRYLLEAPIVAEVVCTEFLTPGQRRMLERELASRSQTPTA